MRKKLIWTTLLIPLLVSLVMVSGVQSSETNMIYVDPSIAWAPSITVGGEFTLSISVDYVSRLCIYQFHLQVDPAILEVIGVANGPFLASAGGVPDFYPGEGFDPETGWLYLVVGALPPGLPPIRYPTGGGVLATVTFRKVGDGSSVIHLGPDCGLIDRWGRFISKGRVQDGFFTNAPGPELYVRRRGAHGTSGSWPEWTVGTAGDGQTLYCRIMNYGFLGADVYVDFVVTGRGTISTYKSNEAEIAAAIAKGEPSEVTVSASFPSGPPGKYRVMVVLYFRAGVVAEYTAYYLLEAFLGGEGLSRDIPVSFKTV